MRPDEVEDAGADGEKQETDRNMEEMWGVLKAQQGGRCGARQQQTLLLCSSVSLVLCCVCLQRVWSSPCRCAATGSVHHWHTRAVSAAHLIAA